MNRRISISAYLAVCLIVTHLVGCISTKQVVPVTTGSIAANSARIVVKRESAFAGYGAPMFITDSGKQIGSIASGGELIWDRIAGPMELTAFYHHIGNGNPVPARICVGSGMSYLFMVSPFDGKHPSVKMVSGTPVACEQAVTSSTGKMEQVQQPSTTTTATNDKHMITQSSASITAPSASAVSLENQNILGISVEPTSGVRGVVVKTVAPGSPCESVLKHGDTIFAFDLIDQNGSRVGGAKVNANNFQAEVLKIQPSMTVKFLLSLRPIREVSCTVPATALPSAPQRQ